MKKYKFIKSIIISALGVSILSLATSLLVVSCSKNQPQTPSVNEPSVPNNPNIQNNLNSSGGEYNNLKIDKHLSTIKLLNLNNDTILSSLNDDALTAKLRTTKGYENMEIKILGGSSEKAGILKLKLVGNYNNVDYDDEVVISGFYVNKKSEFNVSNLKINQKNYFDNHFPIKEKPSLLISDDLNVLKSIINSVDFIIDNKTISFDEMCKRYELQKIDLKLKNNYLNFKFIFNTKFKIYSNGNWIIDSQQEVLNQFPTAYEISILSLKDLMEFMLNQFSLNKDEIKKFYPSYFKGLHNWSVKLRVDKTRLLEYLNFEGIINRYKKTYFPELEIQPIIDISDNSQINANDFTGHLSFDVKLINFDDSLPNELYVEKSFTSDNMKTISSYLDTKKNDYNSIIIKDGDNSSMSKMIKNIFKNEISDAFKQSKEQEFTLSSDSLFSRLAFSWKSIFNIERANANEDTYNNVVVKRINDSYNLSLFSESLNDFGFLNNSSITEPNFDLNTGLFTTSKGDQFYIDNASFDFDKDKLSPILKIGSNINLVSIEFNAIINYSLLNQEFSQNTKFILSITRSSFVGNIK